MSRPSLTPAQDAMEQGIAVMQAELVACRARGEESDMMYLKEFSQEVFNVISRLAAKGIDENRDDDLIASAIINAVAITLLTSLGTVIDSPINREFGETVVDNMARAVLRMAEQEQVFRVRRVRVAADGSA